MSTIGISPFLTPALLRQGAALRSGLEQATSELASARHNDTGAALSGDFTALAGIDAARARIRGHTTAMTEARLLSDGMQAALGVIAEAAESLAANITTTAVTHDPLQVNMMAGQGRQSFETVVNTLNTSVAERALFGGVISSNAPLPDADVLLTALEAATSGATTAEDAMQAIEDWFAAPTGYAALYGGGASRAPISIAEGESVDLGLTALDPALRDTLSALAGVALLDRGLLGGNDAARSSLVLKAGESIFAGAEARSLISSRLGIAQERIAVAQSRNSAEDHSLQRARVELTEADPYEVAARLKDFEARLEAFYTVISRISQLSLTGFLR
ncbi:flagellin [Pseudogemmobacter sonorensis]|uniref:flagellin n=1 Tax=Pseudogemmobacter sonorensis TaxID=2989681 RepID=UPI0036A98853